MLFTRIATLPFFEIGRACEVTLVLRLVSLARNRLNRRPLAKTKKPGISKKVLVISALVAGIPLALLSATIYQNHMHYVQYVKVDPGFYRSPEIPGLQIPKAVTTQEVKDILREEKRLGQEYKYLNEAGWSRGSYEVDGKTVWVWTLMCGPHEKVVVESNLPYKHPNLIQKAINDYNKKNPNDPILQ